MNGECPSMEVNSNYIILSSYLNIVSISSTKTCMICCSCAVLLTHAAWSK